MAEMISKWDVVNKLTELENEFQQYKPFHGFEHAMYRKLCELEMAIGKAPSVEVVHSRWSNGTCMNCKHDLSSWADAWYETPYCPNCGAMMDGERRTE